VIRLDLEGPEGMRMPDDEFFPHPQGNQGPVQMDVQLFLYTSEGDQLDDGP
jgi:hypothetical protein